MTGLWIADLSDEVVEALRTEAGAPDSMALLRAMRGDPEFLLPSDSTDLLRITRDGGMDEVLSEARGNRAA